MNNFHHCTLVDSQHIDIRICNMPIPNKGDIIRFTTHEEGSLVKLYKVLEVIHCFHTPASFEIATGELIVADEHYSIIVIVE